MTWSVHTQVGGAFLDHLQYRVQHADDGAKGTILALIEATQAVKVPEQLVSAVNQVNDHGAGSCKACAGAPSRTPVGSVLLLIPVPVFAAQDGAPPGCI
jgi:hypothetical protein